MGRNARVERMRVGDFERAMSRARATHKKRIQNVDTNVEMNNSMDMSGPYYAVIGERNIT